MWKCRTVENEENQNQASLVFHRPWKSLRDSHIPTTPTTILPFPNQNQKTRKEPQLRRKPQPPSLGSSFDEKMLAPRIDLGCLGRKWQRDNATQNEICSRYQKPHQSPPSGASNAQILRKVVGGRPADHGNGPSSPPCYTALAGTSTWRLGQSRRWSSAAQLAESKRHEIHRLVTSNAR